MSTTVIDRRPAKEGSPWRANHVEGAGVTVGVEATNAINVSIQLRNQDGQDLRTAGAVDIYLSDDSAGQSIAASAPSGGWAIGTDGLLIPIVANKYAKFVSESDGDIDITITESTAKTFYLVIVLPEGSLIITAVTFA